MLSDGYGTRPLDANFVRNAPLTDVQAALRDTGLPTDRLNIPYTALAVDVGPQRALFDTGNGEFGAATAGKLLENMVSAGIDPNSISAVLLSHFRGDHINGLRNKAGRSSSRTPGSLYRNRNGPGGWTTRAWRPRRKR
jgi:ribonuclease BN (tRNA processing enzyme)